MWTDDAEGDVGHKEENCRLFSFMKLRNARRGTKRGSEGESCCDAPARDPMQKALQCLYEDLGQFMAIISIRWGMSGLCGRISLISADGWELLVIAKDFNPIQTHSVLDFKSDHPRLSVHMSSSLHIKHKSGESLDATLMTLLDWTLHSVPVG